MKKIIATISIVTMLIASTVVNAAPLDNAVAGITLTNTNLDNTADAVVETLTVTVAKDFTADTVDSVEIRDNSGNSVYAATGSVVTNNIDSFTIDGVDFDGVLVADLSARYTISFTTVAGDYSAAVLVVNNDNQFTVTANVQPILKFAMENTSDNLGTLTTAYGAGVTTGLEIGTNAVNGVSVTAKTINGGLASTNAAHTINLSGNDALYDNEGYQFTSVAAIAHDSTIDAVITDQIATTMNNTNQSQVIYTADKPQNFDTVGAYDVNFTVTARIAESTPAASDYTDVIIFTATANF